MVEFIKGLELSKIAYEKNIKQLIEEKYPNLKYTAGRLGKGSEVLGYDDEMSMDHDWGIKLQILVEEKDKVLKNELSELLAKRLPEEIKGIGTNFGEKGEDGSATLKKKEKDEKINHGIEIYTIKEFFEYFLNINPYEEVTAIDWLVIPEQRLLSVTAGELFHDQLNVKELREKFSYYPKDVWLFLLMSQFKLIAEEEPFMGRTGWREDELGSKIIAARQAQRLMQLAFYFERKYAPYSKWFGTAFKELKLAKELTPILESVLTANDWKEREKNLSKAYEMMIEEYNKLELTKPFEPKVKQFYTRPFEVINAHEIAEAIKEKIIDEHLKNIRRKIGKIDQITNSVDILDYNEQFKKFRKIYEP